MSPTVRRLNDLSGALRDAMLAREWGVVGELDLQCRQLVQDAMQEAIVDESQLSGSLQELLNLYRDLVTVCQIEQQRLAGELTQLNQGRQGAKVYQLFG